MVSLRLRIHLKMYTRIFQVAEPQYHLSFLTFILLDHKYLSIYKEGNIHGFTKANSSLDKETYFRQNLRGLFCLDCYSYAFQYFSLKKNMKKGKPRLRSAREPPIITFIKKVDIRRQRK